MMQKCSKVVSVFLGFFYVLLFSGCQTVSVTAPLDGQAQSGAKPESERHLKNIRQLTHGGTNAEAYWSYDGKRLTLQRTPLNMFLQHANEGAKNQSSETQAPSGPTANGKSEIKVNQSCDQIYQIEVDHPEKMNLVSTGLGRTTCSYFTSDDQRIVYASTHEAQSECPASPDKSKGYVWPVYPTYRLYSVSAKIGASEIGKPKHLEPKFTKPSYNAEMVTCKDGSVVFTSTRNGDLDLYTAKFDKKGLLTNVKQFTHELGYDGGAVFSPDCSKIAWRASRPNPGPELDDYTALLKEYKIRPGKLEILVSDSDGKNRRQLTNLGVASFAPGFTPDGKSVLFSANVKDPRGRKFELYKVTIADVTETSWPVEQITFSDSFNAFPMFSPDGKYLAFSSNRNAEMGETNVFVAEWVD